MALLDLRLLRMTTLFYDFTKEGLDFLLFFIAATVEGHAITDEGTGHFQKIL